MSSNYTLSTVDSSFTVYNALNHFLWCWGFILSQCYLTCSKDDLDRALGNAQLTKDADQLVDTQRKVARAQAELSAANAEVCHLLFTGIFHIKIVMYAQCRISMCVIFSHVYSHFFLHCHHVWSLFFSLPWMRIICSIMFSLTSAIVAFIF